MTRTSVTLRLVAWTRPKCLERGGEGRVPAVCVRPALRDLGGGALDRPLRVLGQKQRAQHETCPRPAAVAVHDDRRASGQREATRVDDVPEGKGQREVHVTATLIDHPDLAA